MLLFENFTLHTLVASLLYITDTQTLIITFKHHQVRNSFSIVKQFRKIIIPTTPVIHYLLHFVCHW